MKNLLFVTLLLTNYCQAQISKDIDVNKVQVITNNVKDFVGTTETEYNYITKGYKIQRESGLDMKKGYTFKDLNNNFYGIYKMQFKGLYRENEQTPCAIMIIMNYDGDTDYVCIPHYESDKNIWKMYADYIESLGERSKALSWGIAKCAAYFARNN